MKRVQFRLIRFERIARTAARRRYVGLILADLVRVRDQVLSLRNARRSAGNDMEEMRALLRTVYTAWRHGDDLDPQELRRIEVLIGDTDDASDAAGSLPA